MPARTAPEGAPIDLGSRLQAGAWGVAFSRHLARFARSSSSFLAPEPRPLMRGGWKLEGRPHRMARRACREPAHGPIAGRVGVS